MEAGPTASAAGADRWFQWLARERFAHLSDAERREVEAVFARYRDRVLEYARLRPGDLVLDVGCGTGLLAFGAAGRVAPDGRVVGVDISVASLAFCRRVAAEEGLETRMAFAAADAVALPFPDATFDAAVCRSVLMYVERKDAAVRELARVLKPGGRVSVFEPINARLTVTGPPFPPDAPPQVRAAHEAYRRIQQRWQAEPSQQRLVEFDEADLRRWFEETGFAPLTLVVEDEIAEVRDAAAFAAQFRTAPNPLVDSPFQMLAREVGEEAARAYVEYVGQLVARFGQRRRGPGAWLYGVREG